MTVKQTIILTTIHPLTIYEAGKFYIENVQSVWVYGVLQENFIRRATEPAQQFEIVSRLSRGGDR